MATKLFGHYTDPNGLMGVIGNGTLWATNIKFLNDEQEFNHAIELITEILDSPKIQPDDPKWDVKERFVDKLTTRLKSLSELKTEDIFTLSFSEKTDLLSQWRGYCPNDGYSIIIELNKYFESIKPQFKSIYLFRCLYDKEEKTEKLRLLLNKYWKKYYAAKTDTTKNNILHQLSREFMLLASHFKHPSFEEEAEHRIVVVFDQEDRANIKFRKGRFSLIPYIALPFSIEYIKKICIGPTAKKELANRGLTSYIENITKTPYFLCEIDIIQSTTPYRS